MFDFGYIDKVFELGKYCRESFDDDTRTNQPDVPGPRGRSGINIWEFHKYLRLTDELLQIFDKIVIFEELANAGYRLREEPSLIRWRYDGMNRGAADHYHHDGHFGKGGQVSMMLLLESNLGMTHMRIIPNSRNIFGRKVYDALWGLPFRGRGRLFRLNDWFVERFHEQVRLEGPQDRLYFFNAGDNLHKAFPILNTVRTIFHLNLTLHEPRLTPEKLSQIDIDALRPHWKHLLFTENYLS